MCHCLLGIINIVYAVMLYCVAVRKAGGGVDNKNARLAVATLFLNLAVAAHQEPLQAGLEDAYQQLAALYAEVLGPAVSGFADDVLCRFLVGLGTLLTVREGLVSLVLLCLLFLLLLLSVIGFIPAVVGCCLIFCR